MLTISDTLYVAVITVVITMITVILSKHYDQRRQSEDMFFKEKILAYTQFLAIAHHEFRTTNPEIDLDSLQASSAPAMLLSTKTTSDLISDYCLKAMEEHRLLYGTSEDVKKADIIKTSDAYLKMFFAMQNELLSYHHLPFWKRLYDSAKSLRNH